MKSSSEEVQALKKQINQLQCQAKKEKLVLTQQIQLLKYEIEDYKRNDLQTKKLNETVISSYKNNDHARDQILQTSLQDINKKHKQEIQRIVSCHAKSINTLESEIKSLKLKLQSGAEIQEQMKVQLERSIKIKLEDKHREDKQDLQNQIRDLRQKNSNLESKLRKSQHLVKTYREHMTKIDFESQKNQILKNTSIQYSFLSQIDRKNQERDDDDFLMSKMYKSKGRTQCEQSRLLRSQTNILSSADLRTLHQQRKTEDKENNRSRRLTRNFADEVNESARKSRKYLQINRQSIQNLTSRISQAVSSLQKMKRGTSSKKMSEVINKKLETKLRLR